MEVKGNFVNYGSYVDVHDNEVVNLTVQGDAVKMEDGENGEVNPVEGNDVERRVKASIDVLTREGLIKNLYDYTWVMEAMNQTKGMPTFKTPSSLIAFLKSIGIEKLPSDDSINRKQNVFTGKFPQWEFTDCDTAEATRRINVGRRFVNAYRSA